MSKAKRKSGGASSKSPKPADHKPAQLAPPDPAAPFIPRPVHFRLLSAYEQAFQEGKNPSDGVIAALLSVRRETVNRWRRRNPRLRVWLYDSIGRHSVDMRPMVDRRVAQLAIQGSAEHMKLFYQFVAKVGVPRDDAPGTDPMGDQDDARCVINILVPHPELPMGGRLPQLPGPSSMSVIPPLEDIPVVPVR